MCTMSGTVSRKTDLFCLRTSARSPREAGSVSLHHSSFPPDHKLTLASFDRLVALQQWGIDWFAGFIGFAGAGPALTFMLCLNRGILIGYVIEYGCSFIKNGSSQLNFRSVPRYPRQPVPSLTDGAPRSLPWAIQMIPGIILLSGMWFIFPWVASTFLNVP